MMFSSAFSSAFARPVAGYVAPMMAQEALANGAGWSLSGSVLKIDGKILIGPAGKVYAFSSADSASRWIEHTRAAGIRQYFVVGAMSLMEAEKWKAAKRAKLAVVAGQLVNAAAKMGDAARRAALVAESDFCLAKWSQG